MTGQLKAPLTAWLRMGAVAAIADSETLAVCKKRQSSAQNREL